VNPYKNLDRLQDPNADKGNFFETTVINYTQSSNMARAVSGNLISAMSRQKPSIILTKDSSAAGKISPVCS
jgi:hypothetical protein